MEISEEAQEVRSVRKKDNERRNTHGRENLSLSSSFSLSLSRFSLVSRLISLKMASNLIHAAPCHGSRNTTEEIFDYFRVTVAASRSLTPSGDAQGKDRCSRTVFYTEQSDRTNYRANCELLAPTHLLSEATEILFAVRVGFSLDQVVRRKPDREDVS